MSKQPVSVTLDQDNLLWLRGRIARGKRGSLSAALDELIRQARQGSPAAGDARSVVGTIDIAPDDPKLERADAAVRARFEASLSRPILAREDRRAFGSPRKPGKPRRG